MNKTQDYELTIIIPVYNEVDNLDRVEKALTDYIPTATVKTCALFVNDGSTDGSLDKIRQICGRNAHCFFISSNENHGLSKIGRAHV